MLKMWCKGSHFYPLLKEVWVKSDAPDRMFNVL